MLNGRSQQTHQSDKLLLRLGLLSDDFFERFKLIETEQNAVASGPLFERFEPIASGF